MRRILLIAALLALAGCSPPQVSVDVSDTVTVVLSVIESVENAPAVAEASGGWPEAPFPGGSVRVTAAERIPGNTLEYVVAASLPSGSACVGGVRAAARDSERFVLDGGTFVTAELPRSRKSFRRVAQRLCSAAVFPATLEMTMHAAYPARAN